MLHSTLLKLSLATSVALLGFSVTSESAHAFSFKTLQDRNGDQVFNDTDYNLFATGANHLFTTKAVVESRIGNNNSEKGVWESGIWSSTYKADNTYTNTMNNGTQLGQQWSNGKAEDFSLSYNGSELIYTIAGQTTRQAFTGGMTDMLLRTRATGESSISLSDLKLMDSLGNLKATYIQQGSTATTGGVASDKIASDVDYLQVSGLKTGFTLTGKTTFNWMGKKPNGSNLALQWKIGSMPEVSKSVPEPASLLALGLVGTAIARRRKARAQAN
jgi:PEP-CTERM motif